METFERDDITLYRRDDYVWEIPQEGGMRVPGRIFASEGLLEEIAEDKTIPQLRNSAHLPGMTKYALCMPDGHQGYGFPVGGVGAIDANEGCISPGAIGYDINCVTGDTSVQLEFGRRVPIRRLRERFTEERAIVADEDRAPSAIRLFTVDEERPVYRVRTATGETITATPDHPFLTPDGMVQLENLSPGDTVYVSPFKGVRDEEPVEFPVIERADMTDIGEESVARLEQCGLLPLLSTDDAFCRILKLAAYHAVRGDFADSTGEAIFIAKPEPLAQICEDINQLGFETIEHDDRGERQLLRVPSEAFAAVLRKVRPSTDRRGNDIELIPRYFDRLTQWQQALYLSVYFGEHIRGTSDNKRDRIECPAIRLTVDSNHLNTALGSLEFLGRVLKDFGIETTCRVTSPDIGHAENHSLELEVAENPSNLIRFFEQIGYRYSGQQQRRASATLQYLKFRQRQTTSAERNQPQIQTDGGTEASGRRTVFGEYEGRERGQSPTRNQSIHHDDVESFETYREQMNVSSNGSVTTVIESIEPAGSEPVYDIGVTHPAHNFLANGFVVSNCGVRMMRTNLEAGDLEGNEEEIVESLFANIPSGLGGGGVVETDIDTVDEILSRGVRWAVDNGFGVEEDLTHCEDEGYRPEADPTVVSKRAKERGKNQVGSLGSGNHFLEVQRVTDIYRDRVAEAFGLNEGQVVVLIHCGSRGLGHQVCTDYLRKIEQNHTELLASLPDKELAAAPAGSRLAEEYYHAMGAAINFAWVNRQLVMHRTRQVFERVFQTSWEDLGMQLMYDVAHNIGKKEVHEVDGRERELFVHRKGATRAFPAGREELPPVYRDIGQPVIIPGSMGSGSYVLRGGDRSLELSFGSTAHGAGRLMSRTRAKKEYWGGDVQDDLRDREQIYVKAQSGATIAEEAPGVYKDVDEVVRVSEELGIGDTVARTFPICNIKG